MLFHLHAGNDGTATAFTTTHPYAIRQDALYNALQDMEDVLKRMKALDVV